MTINCKGRLVDLSRPKIMGILNLTPDSFYDGGKNASDSAYLAHCEKMLRQGATFIDIGACSTRPGAAVVSQEEEAARLFPAIDAIVKNFPEALLSVDTFRSGIARRSIESGAAMINDISAGLADAQMLPTVGQLKVPYIMMHMRGTPQNMQDLTQYDDLPRELLFYFSSRVSAARKHGINDIIIDPGFGFAKTLPQNYELMASLGLFAMAGLPLLAGVSRKGMIHKLLGISPAEALNGTSVLNMVALQKGCSILRVHDVKEACECVAIFGQLEMAESVGKKTDL